MHFVDMWELQRCVSKRLAELSGAAKSDGDVRSIQ